MSVTLEIPDEMLAHLETNREGVEAEFFVELAVALYRAGKLPPGRAAEVARMPRWQFEEILIQRHVPIPYTREMVEEDFRHARGGQ